MEGSFTTAMERLVEVVQKLSIARDFSAIREIVRRAARELTGADGATFVLKEAELCYYLDEDAIAPLWKGRRFPLDICISGWSMLHRQTVAIEDIYADPRVPVEAYRPTFVKSLAMVPIRTQNPVGAIGNYWATRHLVTRQELQLLQALADTTSVALQNVQLYEDLNRQMTELERANYELKRFAWVVSHDLQEPLRRLTSYSQMIVRQLEAGDRERASESAQFLGTSATRLRNLVRDLETHTNLYTRRAKRTATNANEIVKLKLLDLKDEIAESGAQIEVGRLPVLMCDSEQLAIVFHNLISNAVKFRRQDQSPKIEITANRAEGEWEFCVSDDGIGVEKTYQEKIFGMFERLHSQDHYMGSGIGLATMRKIVEASGGRVWLDSHPGSGSRFFFSIPDTISEIPGIEWEVETRLMSFEEIK